MKEKQTGVCKQTTYNIYKILNFFDFSNDSQNLTGTFILYSGQYNYESLHDFMNVSMTLATKIKIGQIANGYLIQNGYENVFI